MDTISPVVPGLERYEVQYGGKEANQPDETSFPALRSPEGIVVMRWQPTAEERKRIANGEDLYLCVLTNNHPLQAVQLEVGIPFGGTSDLRRYLRLDDEAELRKYQADYNKTAEELRRRQLELIREDKLCNKLGKQLENEKKALDHKKAEVFSDKPAPRIEIAQ
jgi:hypothetical protein